MSGLPTRESNDPRERDHGELFRTSSRELPTVLMKPGSRKVIYGLLAVAVTLGLAALELGR
ncbi:MAG: hypothetical protein H7Y19_07295 [Luteimonas sp.]|nr:hypothetical protein [Luteimonas sp.]